MKRNLVTIAAAFGLLSLVSAATAAPEQPAKGHALTADDVDAFLDGYMPVAIGRGDIAGAVVAVVKDGHLLFEKGYGVSDIARQTPVDPRTTLFRPGSVSKLFTWTAVMQLAEQHKLDLDTDINTYLDFKIPPAFGKPITLRNLMTHTPGFEETDKSLFVTDPKIVVSLATALKAWVPTRVFPPGEIPAYSNYGAALAGYIVQRVSGEPFEQYVERHIFEPLGMRHATFVQPLPKSLAPDMSKGYDKASDGKAQPYELIPMSPAGALAASADDMAHFMIAHLNNGAYGDTKILEPATATKMHGVAYQHSAGVPPMAYGFYHEDEHGHDIIAHGGDTLWFHSDLTLILDQNVGVFVSQNSAGKDGTSIRGPLMNAFMNRYFPAAPLPAEPALKTAKTDGAAIAGYYVLSRNSFDNILSIGTLLGQVKASVNDDGIVTVDLLKNFAGEPRKFREIKPFVWREVNGRYLLYAKRENGQVTELVTDEVPQILSVVRSPWWESQGLNMPLFGAMLAMLALSALFWPIKALLRWRYRSPFPLKGRAAMLYRVARIAVLCDMILYAGGLSFFAYASDNHLELLSASYDWVLRVLQIFGLVGAIGAIAVVLNFGEALRDRARPWWTKVTDGLLAVAAVLSVWYMFSQHMLTLNLNY